MVTKASSTFLKKQILFLVILLLPSIALFAQATANFTADILSGCAPVLVNFTNNSSNATSYSWDLGNGNTSSNMHTSALYAQPGIYTVKLTATGVGATIAPAGVQSVSVSVTGLPDNAQAAADAAAEATDAANAATDAANAAAEAADAATAAAQDAADAVAALSAQVATLISGLKAQLTALTNLVIKIQKKVKA